ncbi:hypothetical protein BOTBODRAFT_149902 [Botryobasidium botryosum FD-172 SS1]|uniref:NAD(P)-binding protein n=1 Tax=Botryobasidium botryosum (strain FD-172 SS1) TaxID=930990 RepID=A0A067N2F5_BOTB1|nr:hypothetical protein BOTBODRAFT_149902 [Botryobasidium botryosum FD-172 SS1]
MTKFDPATDIPDLSGKVALVTGGNSGIGYHTVLQLARHGATVYLAARNETRAQEAIEKLKAEGLGTGSVQWLKLDLGTAKGAKGAADDFLSKEQRLDLLSDHIGPFVLTQALLPLLKKTAEHPDSDVRIVHIASEAYKFAPSSTRYRSKEDFNAITGDAMWTRMSRYGVSKLGNLLFSSELQRRLTAEGSSIISVSVHPGTGAINGLQVLPGFLRTIAVHVYRWISTTAAEGAHATLYAATSPTVKQSADYKGAYLLPSLEITTLSTKLANDPELAAELWTGSEAVAAEALAQ